MRRLAVIVLAAGRSARFASAGHKLLAMVEGEPLVLHAVRAALEAGVGDVLVVTGGEGARVAAALREMPVRIVHATGYANGMAASLRAGIEAARETTDAALIALGDQPAVRPDAYRRVAAAWRDSGAAIVVPRYDHSPAPAHPILFASDTYDELLALHGDVGARGVIGADASRVARVDLDWPAPLDVDTPEDLVVVAADLRAARADPPHAPLAPRAESPGYRPPPER